MIEHFRYWLASAKTKELPRSFMKNRKGVQSISVPHHANIATPKGVAKVEMKRFGG
jgi:hypothetical protein